MKTLKVGLDIHGVIDKHPEIYAALSHALVAAGHEVHIITGIREELASDELKHYGIKYTHYFSIHQHWIDDGTVEITYDDDGRPIMDTHLWDITKGRYCRDTNIDLHIDDSPHYGDHFEPNNIFLFQENKGRVDWRHDAQNTDNG